MIKNRLLFFTLYCGINVDEVVFYLLFDFVCSVSKIHSESHVVWRGRVFSQNWIKKKNKTMPISKKESSRDQDSQVRNFFFSQHAAAVRGTDGGFQHYGQRQLHLHTLATRGDDDGNTQNIVVL